jgi:hypothetical protein
MRASRSSFVNGGTRPANEGRAAIGAGREAASSDVSPKTGRAAAASAADDARKKERLESMFSPELRLKGWGKSQEESN